jgi:eukaryotic translation initiation factor 2C
MFPTYIRIWSDKAGFLFRFQYFQIEPTLILGADVSHPAPGSTNPSIAAVMGSVDLLGVRYYADVRVQPCRMEFIQDMKTIFK